MVWWIYRYINNTQHIYNRRITYNNICPGLQVPKKHNFEPWFSLKLAFQLPRCGRINTEIKGGKLAKCLLYEQNLTDKQWTDSESKTFLHINCESMHISNRSFSVKRKITPNREITRINWVVQVFLTQSANVRRVRSNERFMVISLN